MQARASVWLALALLAGCDPVPPPGTLIGKYAVLRSIVDNNCGAVAMPPADPTSYIVELRENAGQAYWRIDQNEFQSGTIDTSGNINFTASVTSTVIAPDAGAFVQGCGITESETINGRVVRPLDGGMAASASDGGVATPPLTATDTYTFTPTAGSDCHELLTVYGGSFDQLPCTARFTLSGNLTASE